MIICTIDWESAQEWDIVGQLRWDDGMIAYWATFIGARSI